MLCVVLRLEKKRRLFAGVNKRRLVFLGITPVSPAAGHRKSLIEGQPLELPHHEIHALHRSPVESCLGQFQ